MIVVSPKSQTRLATKHQERLKNWLQSTQSQVTVLQKQGDHHGQPTSRAETSPDYKDEEQGLTERNVLFLGDS